MSKSEVSRHIRAPILAANRSHRAIHYPQVHQSFEQRTGKRISLRTLQRYGKVELGIKQKHTKKRTADESKCIHTEYSEVG